MTIGFKQKKDKKVDLDELKARKHLKNYDAAIQRLYDKDPKAAEMLERELFGGEEEGEPDEACLPLKSIEIAGLIYYLKRLLNGKEGSVMLGNYNIINTDYTPIPPTEAEEVGAIGNIDGHSSQIEIPEDGEE